MNDMLRKLKRDVNLQNIILQPFLIQIDLYFNSIFCVLNRTTVFLRKI